MIVKHATQAGNLVIRSKAKAVSTSHFKSKEVQAVIKNLVDSMRHHNLVGMAAPQIGKSLRIFVSEVRPTKLRKGQSVKNIDKLRVYINPIIVQQSKKSVLGWEGCGSVAFANLFGQVKRPQSLTVEAYDEKGEKFRLEAKGLLARIIQHELDHLNGVLFVDTSNPKTFMSRDEYLKKFAKKKK